MMILNKAIKTMAAVHHPAGDKDKQFILYKATTQPVN